MTFLKKKPLCLISAKGEKSAKWFVFLFCKKDNVCA